MTTYELIGRYAEDPFVYIEALTPEAAAQFAVDHNMAVSRGYWPGGSLIPIPVAARDTPGYVGDEHGAHR